jgi:hypothetical protein
VLACVLKPVLGLGLMLSGVLELVLACLVA